MTPTTLKRLAALTLFCCFGLVSSAHADPDGSTSPIHDQDRVVPAVSAKFLARLSLLEGARRLNRAQEQADANAWTASRAERAAQHRKEIAELWGNVVYRIDGQANLRIHAERMSRLNRMLDLAQQAADQALIVRIRADITRELTRHAKSMQSAIAMGGQ